MACSAEHFRDQRITFPVNAGPYLLSLSVSWLLMIQDPAPVPDWSAD